MNTKSIGKRIKEARLKNQLTQQQFAEMLGMSTTYISAIEQGVKIPRLETFIRIANLLNVSADFLLADVVKGAFVVKTSLLSEQLDGLNKYELKLVCDVIEVIKENLTSYGTNTDKN